MDPGLVSLLILFVGAFLGGVIGYSIAESRRHNRLSNYYLRLAVEVQKINIRHIAGAVDPLDDGRMDVYTQLARISKETLG